MADRRRWSFRDALQLILMFMIGGAIIFVISAMADIVRYQTTLVVMQGAQGQAIRDLQLRIDRLTERK